MLCTANVALGKHNSFDQLSDAAVSRIVSLYVLSYLGDKAVKEAASTLVDIHKHYRSIEDENPGAYALLERKKVGKMREVKESKVFSAD